MKHNQIVALLVSIVAIFALAGCDIQVSTDAVQRKQQEIIQAELSAKTGMPSIKNGRERKILKDIYELRDQEGLVTYTYIVAENTGKLIFLGETIGYGISAATQYTSPQKVESTPRGYVVIPQADPNGLFSPASTEGTWILMKDPNGTKVLPVYSEPRIIASPFKLNTQ